MDLGHRQLASSLGKKLLMFCQILIEHDLRTYLPTSLSRFEFDYLQLFHEARAFY